MAADPLRLGSDEERFDSLYREYAGDVYRYALAIMRNPADAEDVTQTTFLNAWRAFSAGEEPRAPQNWFISIAHNVCRLKFRTRSRRPHEVEFEPALAEAPANDGPSASEVLGALAELPLNQRAALVMRELEGRSYPEIASILGVSRAAVETLIFRARRSLRVRRDALRTLAVLPLPQSLASFVRTRGATEAGGAALLGSGVAAKVAALFAAGAVAVGVGSDAVRADTSPAPKGAAPAQVQTAEPSPAIAPGSFSLSLAAPQARPGATGRVLAAKASVPAAPATRSRRGRLATIEDVPAGGAASPPASPALPTSEPAPGPASSSQPSLTEAPTPVAAPPARETARPTPPAPPAVLPQLPPVPSVPVPDVPLPSVPLPSVPPVVAVPPVPAVPAVSSAPLPTVPAPAPTAPPLPVELPQPPAELPVVPRLP